MFAPIGILSAFFVPPSAPRPNKSSLRRLDLPGVSLITSERCFFSVYLVIDSPDVAAIIVFIYAITSGYVLGRFIHSLILNMIG